MTNASFHYGSTVKKKTPGNSQETHDAKNKFGLKITNWLAASMQLVMGVREENRSCEIMCRIDLASGITREQKAPLGFMHIVFIIISPTHYLWG